MQRSYMRNQKLNNHLDYEKRSRTIHHTGGGERLYVLSKTGSRQESMAYQQALLKTAGEN